MTYDTINAAYEALRNESEQTHNQLKAVRKKLRENACKLDAIREDPDIRSDPLRLLDISRLEEKSSALKNLEFRLKHKDQKLTKAIIDFCKHNW